jgi:hypothetical protein
LSSNKRNKREFFPVCPVGEKIPPLPPFPVTAVGLLQSSLSFAKHGSYIKRFDGFETNAIFYSINGVNYG